jgi:acyl-CoA synthetase (AMP-forming)/AMP-acid ligase II
MAGRACYPRGKVQLDRYARSGYGLDHRIAFLFSQRPEFLFHYYTLNALGCSIVPLNPDYRREEIPYVIKHSEARLTFSIESRLDDMRTVCGSLDPRMSVVALEDFPARLPEPL